MSDKYAIEVLEERRKLLIDEIDCLEPRFMEDEVSKMKQQIIQLQYAIDKLNGKG